MPRYCLQSPSDAGSIDYYNNWVESERLGREASNKKWYEQRTKWITKFRLMIERGEYPLYGPLNSGAPAAVNFVAGESALRIIELQSMSAITSMKRAHDIKTTGILDAHQLAMLQLE